MASSPIPVAHRIFAPIHPDGHKFVAPLFVAAIVGFFLCAWIGWLLLLLTIAVALFFRDPHRLTPQGEGLVIAPADGLVVAIEKATPPPELRIDKEMMRVSIFLSLLDCHVNRAPVSGVAKQVAYQPGSFLTADKPDASDDNERRSLVLETDAGAQIVCVQIAGKLARRIITNVTEGEHLQAGERIGLIRFGSRADVYFDADMSVRVGIGQRMVGGETILADENASDSLLEFEQR